MKKTLLVMITVCVAATALAAQVVPNMPSPLFSLKDLNGRAVALADLKGKVVILNFWATWCPPCRAEIPDFVAFYDQNKTKGLEIIGISVDDRRTAGDIPSVVRANKITYPVVMFTEKIVRDYGPIDAIPTTFIVDKTGKIRYTEVGKMAKETLLLWFEKLAAEK